MATKAYPAAIIMMFLFCPFLWAETSTIKVNLDDQTADPEVPTVNNWSNDTIIVKITGKPELKDIVSTIDVQTDMGKNGAFPTVDGRIVSVSFRKCLKGNPCPDYKSNKVASSWTIYSDGGRSFVFKIFSLGPPDERGNKQLTSEFGFSIRVEQKPFGLAFSAGFAGFAGLKDKRYHLISIDGDSENATLAPASDKNIPYQLAAFAHYLPHRWNGSNGPAIGLAIDVPVENLSLMLGWTFAARTLPVVNTGYITVGLAYAQRDRLRPDFEGRSTVPANLDLSTLTEKSYGVGAFVAVSFGFFGGERQFKGVFPADNGSGGNGGN